MSPESRKRYGQVEIKTLTKIYDEVVAVNDVSLVIEPGEFIALLGPSGCGKTTILRSIAGLISPSSGDILIDGKSLLAIPAYKRDLGMVFQSYALFPHMQVFQNVAFGLRMRGIEKTEIKRRVGEALELVQMGEFEERYPRQLSGQQQRIALARALVTEPKVILLDEPFGALDAKLRRAMQIELRQIQKRLGITTIFVTHDQEEAMTMADRIAIMRQGRVEQCGDPQKIYAHPATVFVADFIGQMNRLSGYIEPGMGNERLLRLQGGEKPFLVKGIDGMTPGQKVVAMVRPERVSILPKDAPTAVPSNTMEAHINEVIFTGEKFAAYLDTKIGIIIAFSQNRSGAEAQIVIQGKGVQIYLGPDDILVFPQPESTGNETTQL